jgi:hypothetical protein
VTKNDEKALAPAAVEKDLTSFQEPKKMLARIDEPDHALVIVRPLRARHRQEFVTG